MVGDELRRAVREGEQYFFVNPTDEEVADALALAKRHLEEATPE
jgi:hypothetical protein